MATQTIKTVFQFRRGTTAEWLVNKDTKPAAGEPCFDTELNMLKIGNGVDTYENLKPISGAQFEIAADGKSIFLDDKTLKLIGFDDAPDGAQPIKKDGKLVWMVPSTETVDGLQKTIASLQTDVSGLQESVTDLKDIVGISDTGTGTLLDRVESLETKMDGTGDDSIDAKIDAKINEFATRANDDGVVNTIQELFNYVADHGSDFNAVLSDIAGLKSLVGEGSVDSRIAAAVADKVDKVDGMGLSTNDFTNSLMAKLEAIEEKAQVNVIENVNVGGSILDIVNKTVDIPVATLDKAGVVKSSTGVNKVNISNNGEMSVNKVSVHSVFVPIGDELILDGGSASKDAPVYPTRVGNIGFNNIFDAVNHVDNGDVVTLQEDINMGASDNDHLVVNAENVTIDLGGKTLTANGSNGAIKVEGGLTTLDGAGTVQGTLGSDKYSMAVWCAGENAKVVINDGTYCNSTDNSERGTDLIYASAGGNIEINGGTFIAANPEWTLNVKDSDYASGISNIVVRGGKFYKFNPADCNSEGQHTSFVAEGYKSVEEGEYYVVKPM